MRKYYSMATSGREADVYIFGEITSWEYLESDVSSYTLAAELRGLDVDVINVHINSYGGEVAEGLAIYHMLKNHPAKIKTYCDGFACSIASVIFMAGDERIMQEASLLMIHNVWTYTAGNAEQLRKVAGDLDKINQAGIAVYLEHVNIGEDRLEELLEKETYIYSNEALEMGFATSIVAEAQTNKVAASAKKALFNLIQSALMLQEIPVDTGTDGMPEPTPEPAPEPTPTLTLENQTIKFLNALMGGKE